MIWQKFLIHVLTQIVTSPGAAPPIYRKEWATIFIAVAWNIWLARNRKVFDNYNISSSWLESNCWETLIIWAHRCKQLNRQEEIKNWATLENR
jgi:hypothetical protein